MEARSEAAASDPNQSVRWVDGTDAEIIEAELVETIDDRGKRIARQVAGAALTELERQVIKWLRDRKIY